MSRLQTIWERKHEVTSAEADFKGRIRPGALVNIFIQAAIEHANHLGFGFDSLSKDRLFWVLSRMHVQIDKAPQWGEELKVETWPKSVQGPFYLRDFMLVASDGGIRARASSAWLAIDTDSKRPRKLKKESAVLFEEQAQKHALNVPLNKLKCLGELAEIKIKPSFFDIDINNHVTATRYIDWALDSFDMEFHANNYPSLLIINYTKETLPGETLLYKKEETANLEYAFEVTNASSNSLAAQIKISF